MTCTATPSFYRRSCTDQNLTILIIYNQKVNIYKNITVICTFISTVRHNYILCVLISEIVERVHSLCSTPYRPRLPDTSLSVQEQRVMSLMKQCWEDDPKHRPRMDSVVFTFRRLNGGRQDFYYILPYLSNGIGRYYMLFEKGYSSSGRLFIYLIT